MGKKSASYSAGSDKHDEHKHLFGSGGNSDFIINMSSEGAQKLCGIYAMISIIVLALASVPYYISKQINPTDRYMMLYSENSSSLVFIIPTALLACGFFGFLIFMISCVKKEIYLNRNKGLALFALILVSALISVIASKEPKTGIYGYLDRSEGLLSLIGYIGFFAIGVSLTSQKWRSAASGTIIGVGTLNAVMGILQSIPALKSYIPSYYNYLFIGYRTDVTFAEYFNNYAGYDASYAADGFTCSPFALAAVLTVACAFSVNGAAYAKKNSSRVICLVCTGLMTGAAIVTQTVTALIGIGAVLAVSFVLALSDRTSAGKDGKKSINKGAVISSILSIVTGGAILAGVIATDNFRLRDERIIFTDSFERLGIAYNAHSAHEGWIYPTLWYDGWLVFSDNVLLGTGPDAWSTMYADGEGMETDRTYNEYLDISVTRGVLGLAVYLAAVIATFIRAAKMLSSARKDGSRVSKATACGAFTALTAYVIQAFFNTTSITCTPFFMLTLGLIWSVGAETRRAAETKSDK